MMKNAATVLTLLAMAAPLQVMAHSASPYILPELFDTKAATLSLQSGITVEKFYVPSRNFKTEYQLTRPDGSTLTLPAAAQLSRMSVAEVELPAEGTYRIRTLNSESTTTNYALVDGHWIRIRAARPNMVNGNNANKADAPAVAQASMQNTAQNYSQNAAQKTAQNSMQNPSQNPSQNTAQTAVNKAKPESASAQPPRFLTPEQVPANAKRMDSINTPIAETFVSKGKPSTLPAITGQGLELKLLSHPNQAFVGDDFKAQILFNGKPVSNQEVDVFLGANAYALDAKRELPALRSNGNGEMTLPLSTAGIYLISFAYPEPATSSRQAPPAQSYSYGLTLEVSE